MKLEVFTAEPLVFERDRVYEGGMKHNMKPHGFWVSVKGEDDWPHWAEGEQFHWPEAFNHRYEVTLAEGHNVLVIENRQQFLDFHEEFKVSYYTPEQLKAEPRDYRKYLAAKQYIDWDRVKSKYDGIIIAPYQWEFRLNDKTFWFYGWDCASGCIWNLDVIDVQWKEQDWASRNSTREEVSEYEAAE